MNKRRVVVTGIGAITPVGNTVQEAWKNVVEGRSGVTRITRFDPSPFTTQIAAEVKGFDAAQYIEAKEIKKLDLFTQYAVASAEQAVADSGVLSAHAPHRMGCVIGVGIGGLPILERYHEAFLEGGPRKISPFLIPAMISNLAPGNIAIKYGLKGPNFTVTSACTSGLHAIGESYRMIAYGIQDVMVTGGSESAICPMGIGGFCAMKAMSTRNDEPERASRPFDKDRDGFIMGDGAAVLVLEELEAARQRGAKIYAEVVGYGASCDAFHITAPCTDGEGAVKCMTLALEDAGIAPEKVGYVNAHGTSTPANDVSETAAIKQVFGAWANNGLLVSSTKSVTGHLLGAAGAVEAMFSVLAIDSGVIPPTMNLENPEETCDLDYVAGTARQQKVDYVISNNYGFGGTNGSLVFGRV